MRIHGFGPVAGVTVSFLDNVCVALALKVGVVKVALGVALWSALHLALGVLVGDAGAGLDLDPVGDLAAVLVVLRVGLGGGLWLVDGEGVDEAVVEGRPSWMANLTPGRGEVTPSESTNGVSGTATTTTNGPPSRMVSSPRRVNLGEVQARSTPLMSSWV